MSESIKFDWSVGFSDLSADLLDRAKYANFLNSFLVSKGKGENFVLNVNASWGAGKTWFLKRWADEIKSVHPVVFIDAWKSDHSKDPFLAVISAISNDLEKMVDPRRVESTLTKKSWLLIKSVAPEITKGIIKKYLGADFDVISDKINKDDGDVVADIGSNIVKELINLHDSTNNTIDEFKLAVSNYLECIECERKLTLPLFVFIDELDRCRPTYAIEMLETIKHIFDMKKVVFIVATDKSQLQHSIKAVYGSGFNSTKYLDRFFDRTVTLQRKNNECFIESKLTSSGVLNEYVLSESKNNWIYGDGIQKKNILLDMLSKISYVFDMDLRTISQWIDRLDASLSNGNADVNVFYLAFLLAANCVDYSLYNGIVTKKYEGDKVGNIRGYISNERASINTILNFTLNTSVMGELVEVGDDIVSIPWQSHLVVNFDILDMFKCFEDSLDVSQFGNVARKLYVKIKQDRDFRRNDFNRDALVYLFMVINKEVRIKNDSYLQLVELATILE
ncbi:TPA: P-loop NTPase fold protein [Serratia marcescens]